MICASITMLLRVATIGARKMTAQGYTYRPDGVMENAFIVTTPNGQEYTIFPYDSAPFCPCMFHKNNRARFGSDCTCKHIEYIKNEEARAAALVAHVEEIGEAKVWEGYGDLRYTLGASHAHTFDHAAVALLPTPTDEDDSDPVEGDWDNIY